MSNFAHILLTILTFSSIESWSKRACPRFCSDVYKPVCGNNGVTYGNECRIMRASCQHHSQNIIVIYNGECKSTSPNAIDGALASGGCNQFCNEHYQPVCGNNGLTYGNECRLNRAACYYPEQNIKMLYRGECIT